MNIIIQEYDEKGKGRYALVPLDEDGNIERDAAGDFSQKSTSGTYGIADTKEGLWLVNSEPIYAWDILNARIETSASFLGFGQVNINSVPIETESVVGAAYKAIQSTKSRPYTVHVTTATLEASKVSLRFKDVPTSAFGFPIFGNLYGANNRILIVCVDGSRELFTFKLENNVKY